MGNVAVGGKGIRVVRANARKSNNRKCGRWPAFGVARGTRARAGSFERAPGLAKSLSLRPSRSSPARRAWSHASRHPDCGAIPDRAVV